jgi:hypothetical protein
MVRRPEPNEVTFVDANLYVYVDMDEAQQWEDEHVDRGILEELEQELEHGLELLFVDLRKNHPTFRFEFWT